MPIKQKLRSEIEEKDKWDLTTIYRSLDEFNKDYQTVKVRIEEFKKYESIMMQNGHTLLQTIEEDLAISRIIHKLYTYAHLNSDSDTANTQYQELQGKVSNLDNEYSKIASFILPNLLKYDDNVINKMYLEEPKLEEHRFNLDNILRYRNHILSDKEEKIINSFSQVCAISEEIFDIFTNADMNFGIIKDENGEEIELTNSNYGKFLRSKDRKVRADVFHRLYEVYASYKNTMAKVLIGNIKTNVTLSQMKNYSSALESALFADNINLKVYDNLIETIHQNFEPLYHYFDLKKKYLKVDELHLYDTYASLVGDSDKEYTFEEAKQIVINALSILGDDYINDLNKAFDERWIDIYENKGKVSGAYSSGAYDTNPFLLLNFNGTLDHVSTLAHELGHSMHSYYSRQNNPFQYSQYKIFVAEVASTVNELLLANYLLKNAQDDTTKLVVLNNLLDMFKGTIYRQVMFAEFEKKIYEYEEKNEVLTHEVLSNIYYQLNQEYFGKEVIIDDDIRYEWMRIPHLYYNFYVYKYATGLSAACHIVKRIMNNEENAKEDYLEFLCTGGRDHPLEELKIAGVDMTNKEVVESAIDMFKEYLENFESLYDKIKK